MDISQFCLFIVLLVDNFCSSSHKTYIHTHKGEGGGGEEEEDKTLTKCLFIDISIMVFMIVLTVWPCFQS